MLLLPRGRGAPERRTKPEVDGRGPWGSGDKWEESGPRRHSVAPTELKTFWNVSDKGHQPQILVPKKPTETSQITRTKDPPESP